MLITLNAQMNPSGRSVEELDAKTREMEARCQSIGGVRILPGHNPHGQALGWYQELTAIMERGPDGRVVSSLKEHFGYIHALGDPVFEGEYPGAFGKSEPHGNGAVDGAGNWRPLATGEFLLGYPDEAQEIAGAAMPLDFSRNGTLMAYRKLHQNVVASRNFMTETAARFGTVAGIDDPLDAKETLTAKMAGRWSDGVPLARARTTAEWRKFNVQYLEISPDKNLAGCVARSKALIDFTYKDDPQGLKCPITSHMRRVNTRDGLAPTAPRARCSTIAAESSGVGCLAATRQRG
jgi:hypothetical protein